MRNYPIENYAKERNELFEFLIDDYNFSLVEDVNKVLYILCVYEKNNIRIRFNYDLHDNFFDFLFIKGKDTPYPNDLDQQNIVPFFRLFHKYQNDLNQKKLQPDDTQYFDSLKLNALLLKKYGAKVLNEEEWIQ